MVKMSGAVRRHRHCIPACAPSHNRRPSKRGYTVPIQLRKANSRSIELFKRQVGAIFSPSTPLNAFTISTTSWPTHTTQDTHMPLLISPLPMLRLKHPLSSRLPICLDHRTPLLVACTSMMTSAPLHRGGSAGHPGTQACQEWLPHQLQSPSLPRR